MKVKQFLALIITPIFFVILTGCHEGPSAGDKPPIGQSESSITIAQSGSNTLTLTNNLDVLTNFTISTTGSLSGLTITPAACNNVSPNGGTCTVTLSTNNNPSGTGKVVITNREGESINIPIAIDTPSVNFAGTSISTVGNNTVTITNNSDISDTFTSLGLSAGSSNLTLASTTCSSSLAAGASCTATITAVASSIGSATLSFSGGNINGESTTLSVPQPTVEFQNAGGTALANVHVDSNATTTIYIKNEGSFNVQNLALALSGTTDVTIPSGKDTCTGTLSPGATCSFAAAGGANPSAISAAIIRASGNNITNTDLPITASDDVFITAVDTATQTATERGISVLELQLENNTPNPITNVTLTSNAADVTKLNTAARPDNCSGQTIAAGGECTFWLQANNEETLGNDTTATLSLEYTQGIQHEETVPLIVTTSLYAAGNFSLTGGTTCYTTLDADGTPSGTGDCSNIARFDGTNWFQAANAKFSGDPDLVIRDMILANDNLYLAGNFTNLDVSPTGTPDNAYYLASWNGTNATSVGTSVQPFTAPVDNVFEYVPDSTSSSINMLAYDANNNHLFFNRAVTGSGVNPALIYTASLDDATPNWTLIGSAQDPANPVYATSMAYNTGNDTLYVTGVNNKISANTRALVWSWNGTNWSSFTPAGVNINSVSLANLLVNNNTLYVYYGTSGLSDFLCTVTDLGTPSCTPTTLAGDPMFYAGTTGLISDGTALTVVGLDRDIGIATVRTIPLAGVPSANLTGNGNQMVFSATNVGTSRYIGGLFNNFEGTASACLARVNSDNTVTAVTGLTAAACSGIFTANQDVIFKVLTVPSLRLGE